MDWQLKQTWFDVEGAGSIIDASIIRAHHAAQHQSDLARPKLRTTSQIAFWLPINIRRATGCFDPLAWAEQPKAINRFWLFALQCVCLTEYGACTSRPEWMSDAKMPLRSFSMRFARDLLNIKTHIGHPVVSEFYRYVII